MSANSTELKLGPVGQIGILVKDLEAATAFYRDKLGLKHLFTGGGMAFFDLDGQRLMLGQAGQGPWAAGTTFLYYRVKDIHDAFEALKARGVTVLEDPELAHRAPGMELWLANFKDMDGIPLILMCEKKVAA